MIKVILTPVTGDAADAATLETAFRVATDLDAHVEVLFARPRPADAVPILGEGVSSTIIEELMQAAERDAATRRAAARASLDAASAGAAILLGESPGGSGRPSAAWREIEGRADAVVERAARLADLVILGRDDPAAGGAAQVSLAAEAALLGGGRPVLLLPPVGIPGPGRTVAVAWNGTAPAARAVQGALPFLRRAAAVHVISVGTPRTEVSRAEELCNYLAWHGVNAQPRPVEPGADPIGAVLLREAAAVGADLLVMGGYGHSRMREFIMGGVTRYVMANAGLPVLMAH